MSHPETQFNLVFAESTDRRNLLFGNAEPWMASWPCRIAPRRRRGDGAQKRVAQKSTEKKAEKGRYGDSTLLTDPFLRYISTAVGEEEIDLEATIHILVDIEKDIQAAMSKHIGFLKELGLPLVPSTCSGP